MRLITALFVALVSGTPLLADGFGFRTPSGNIYCNGAMQGGPYLDCTIINREGGSAPPGFGNCPAGRSFHVSIQQSGQVSAACGSRSGRLSTYTDVANYGVSASFGRISCLSQSTGFSCQNASGNGFFLSRRSQQLF